MIIKRYPASQVTRWTIALLILGAPFIVLALAFLAGWLRHG